MIPSTLAAEVGGALQDFLATGFGPSNPALSSVVDDFLADTENLLKGPYLAVELPFQRASEGGEPFPETPLGFTPYRHQRTAFDRLAGGRSTVIATGTGSGKTECFLYPVLDHCRERSGTPGVKAIFIYPMNALASDQARRIAGIINRTKALRGKVTAGLHVGETGASPRTHMTAEHLIENRDVLRERPPDILLTNYKMLDLLRKSVHHPRRRSSGLRPALLPPRVSRAGRGKGRRGGVVRLPQVLVRDVGREGADPGSRAGGKARRGGRPACHDERAWRRGARDPASGQEHEGVGARSRTASCHHRHRGHAMCEFVAHAGRSRSRSRPLARCSLPRSRGGGPIRQM